MAALSRPGDAALRLKAALIYSPAFRTALAQNNLDQSTRSIRGIVAGEDPRGVFYHHQGDDPDDQASDGFKHRMKGRYHVMD